MPALLCSDFLEVLGPWMEGEKHPAAEEHLSQCERCRGIVADLEVIRAASRQLAEVEVEPPARVWEGICARLDGEGVGRRLRWKDRLAASLPSTPGPALAGAYLSLILLGAFLVSSQNSYVRNETRWLAGTQASAATLDHELGAVERDTVSTLRVRNPVVKASLNQNLAIVDNYIALCEKSVREDPQNQIVRGYLYNAYQQKADLLATMSEQGVGAQ